MDLLAPKRLETMQKGVSDLHTWLLDISLQGIAIFENDQDAIEHMAKRMVDTKNAGIGRILRSFPRIIREEVDWSAKIVHNISLLYLYVKAFGNLEKLNPNLQDDILQFGGVNIKKEQFTETKGIVDEWRILGVQLSYEDRLRKRKTWLKGDQTGKYALLLDFTFGRQRFEYSLRTGESLVGEIVFYPSAFPLRAMVKKKKKISKKAYELEGFSSIASFDEFIARGLKKNPWIWQFPAIFDKVQPYFYERKFFIKDQNDQVLELEIPEEAGWDLLSLSGGQEIQIFGEWDHFNFRPLSHKDKSRTYRI